MLQNLRIVYLRVLSIVGLLFLISSSFYTFLSDGSVSTLNTVMVPVMLIAFILSYFESIKGLALWIVPIVSLTTLVMGGAISEEGGLHVVTSNYYLFPLYVFFLLGARWGLVLSLLLIGSTLLPLSQNGFNMVIYGDVGVLFPLTYVVEIALLSTLEWVHSYMLLRIDQNTNTDELTGLMNRLGTKFHHNNLLDEVDEFYTLFIDLNSFSQVNSYVGPIVSDDILRKCGEILGKREHVLATGRYYADSFVVMFEGSEEDLIEYVLVSEKKIYDLAAEIGIDLVLSISTGISHYPNDSDESEELINFAELAMKEAKISKSANYHFFESRHLTSHEKNTIIGRDLKRAISEEKIEVYFQPKVSTIHECVTGMEALVRWVHPELGYLAPPEYINIAERSGDIVILGEYVMKESLDHLRSCREAGNADISVSINISPFHLVQTDFLENLKSEVKSRGLAPKKVYLEITENVMIKGEMKERLQTIQNAGFNLSLDDFGTGYSSLNYLSQFSFNELKIDKSFTDGILKSQRECDLFETILTLAKKMDMETVIEGVEKWEQVALIQRLGADEIQGWYYAKALASAEFLDFMATFKGRVEHAPSS